MGKLANYIIVLSGILLLFYFSGFLGETLVEGCEETGVQNILICALINPQNLPEPSTALTEELGIVIGAAATAVISIGLVLTGNLDVAIAVATAPFIINLLWGFLEVVTAVYSVNPVLAIVFFGPLLVYLVILIIEWIAGRDN